MNRQPPQLARLVSITSLIALAATAFASAQSSRGRVHLSYAAPSSCPQRAEFEAQVSSRVTAPWLAPDGELARALRVTVASSQGAWQASLELEGQSGQILSRSVTANDCAASVEAIALATALLLESASAPANASATASGEAAPSATVPTPSASAPSATVPTASAPAAPTAVAPTSFARATAPQASAVPAPHQPQPEPKAAPASPEPAPQWNPRRRLRPELGSSFGSLTGLGSGLAYGATLFGGLSTESTLTRLGLAAYQTGFATTNVHGVRLRVRLLAAKIEHCPLALPIARGLSLLACVGIETGILLTNGRAEAGIDVDAKTGQALWFMAGLTPKLGYRWKRVFAELEPELFVPVTRREFGVAAAAGSPAGRVELAHRTPVLAFGGLLSLGLQFE